MRRNGRKEVTKGRFVGVAEDGGFVFEVIAFSPKRWAKTTLKVVSYEKGVMEIAIDYKKSISMVAWIVAGMFSEKSDFENPEFISKKIKKSLKS